MSNFCNWSIINIRSFCDYFYKYERVYMESAQCPNLIEIYKKCIPVISIEFINEDNYEDITKNSLFIWEENKYEEIHCTKVNCKDLYTVLYDDSVLRLKSNIESDVCVPKIEEDKFTPEVLVKYFDEEQYTVCIVDRNNDFLYALCRQDMRKEFRFSDIPKRKDLFIEDTCNNVENAAKIFLTIGQAENIPVLKNRKVIAVMLRRLPRKQTLQWDWIEEETILQIWDKGSKLLVSSLSDDIQGFMNRFVKIYQIDIFNEKNYQKYLSGKYAALVYSTDIWRNAVTQKCNIKQLYLDCLSNDMLAWFRKNDIEYYFFEMSRANEIIQFYERTVNISAISGDNIEINGCYFQRDAQRDGFHVYGGRRFTVGEPDRVERTIYVYGPCIALGNFVTDVDTIESQLQRHINSLNLGYKVVNCGGGDSPYEIGNDINSFYIMANTKFKPNDIVIHFGLCTWKNAKMRVPENFYRCAEVFNDKDVLDAKCFSQYSAAHLNALGNSILERYIFSKIKKSLGVKKDFGESLVSYGRIKKQIDNDNLSQWIKELEMNKTCFQKVGCIVMNANPFTKGHYYLIERSRAEVEYLYVFIVEEDRSFFSFEDRYKMTFENCKNLQNVKVLPSGKYIISGLTFEEYFNKDVFLNKVVSPGMDIQMFANYVAPALNISIRFVGEEKSDMVTAQYNKAMKELLPLEGIEVIEYPRYSVNGEIISASKVRKCIKEKKWEEIEKYLTLESVEYIGRLNRECNIEERIEKYI